MSAVMCSLWVGVFMMCSWVSVFVMCSWVGVFCPAASGRHGAGD